MNGLADAIAAFCLRASRLEGAQCRLALYLLARALKTGSRDVRVSSREVNTQTGMSRWTVLHAHVGLRAVGVVPQTWYDTRSTTAYHLEFLDCVPVLPAPVNGNGHLAAVSPGAATVPPGMATVPATGAATVPPGMATVPATGAATVPPGMATVPATGAATVPPGMATVPAHNKERARARSTSKYLSIGSSIVGQDVDSSPQRQDRPNDADTLRRYLRSFVAKTGNHVLAADPIDDVLIGRCMEIASVDDLLCCLSQIRPSRRKPVVSYGWFLTVFVDRLYKPQHGKARGRHSELEPVRKPAVSEAGGEDFVSDVTRRLVNSCKGLG